MSFDKVQGDDTEEPQPLYCDGCGDEIPPGKASRWPKGLGIVCPACDKWIEENWNLVS